MNNETRLEKIAKLKQQLADLEKGIDNSICFENNHFYIKNGVLCANSYAKLREIRTGREMGKYDKRGQCVNYITLDQLEADFNEVLRYIRGNEMMDYAKEGDKEK